MRMDLGYILGHACELALFLYFVNTSFIPKKNYIISSMFAAVGYIILFVIGLFRVPWISIISFLIVNIIIIKTMYIVMLRAAIFYSLVLDVLSCVGEYMVYYLMGFNLSNAQVEHITQYQSLAITVGGKLIYLIGILLMKHLMNYRDDQNNTFLALSVVPAATIVLLNCVMTSDMDYYNFVAICIMSILINSIIFVVSEKINKNNHEFNVLQAEYTRNKTELQEYQLLAEKNDNMRIIHHDIKKHFSMLKRLIDEDSLKANEYVMQLEQSYFERNYTQYSDNKILNILLMQKAKESREQQISMHIQSSMPQLGFISDIDTVAIFSNLLDNAIESSEKSSEKIIFVDLYTVNETYSVIKIENSSDDEPLVLDGVLRTQKIQKDLHGLGIKSINNSLKKYGSELSWSYDGENKFFRSVVVFHCKQYDR